MVLFGLKRTKHLHHLDRDLLWCQTSWDFQFAHFVFIFFFARFHHLFYQSERKSFQFMAELIFNHFFSFFIHWKQCNVNESLSQHIFSSFHFHLNEAQITTKKINQFKWITNLSSMLIENAASVSFMSLQTLVQSRNKEDSIIYSLSTIISLHLKQVRPTINETYHS